MDMNNHPEGYYWCQNGANYWQPGYCTGDGKWWFCGVPTHVAEGDIPLIGPRIESPAD